VNWPLPKNQREPHRKEDHDEEQESGNKKLPPEGSYLDLNHRSLRP
jgi:hypothetical protein